MKNIKKATEEEIIKVLKDAKYNSVSEDDLEKNENGQYIVPENTLVVKKYSISISIYGNNIGIGRIANKYLKKLGYYTRIIRVRAKSIIVWVSIDPIGNKKKYGDYM